MKNRISNNFTLNELTKSNTAIRHNIENIPTMVHYKNLVALVENLLQPLRNDIGPIICSSGYRSLELNKLIKGSPTSQHTKGEAVDIECFSLSNYELAKYIETYFDFDQLILEFYNKENKNSGWVHVSYSRRHNKKEVLSASKDEQGKTFYLKGLHA